MEKFQLVIVDIELPMKRSNHVAKLVCTKNKIVRLLKANQARSTHRLLRRISHFGRRRFDGNCEKQSWKADNLLMFLMTTLSGILRRMRMSDLRRLLRRMIINRNGFLFRNRCWTQGLLRSGLSVRKKMTIWN